MYRAVAVTLIVVAALTVSGVWACGGYKLNLKSIKNCGGGNDVLQLSDGFTSTLTDKCHVHPQGCVTAKQDIQQAMITYDVIKDGMMPLKGTVDACKEMEKADEKTVELVMTLAGIPPRCPIPAGERCANGTTIDVTQHKAKMSAAAGSYKGRITSDHGDNKSSCIEFEAALKQ